MDSYLPAYPKKKKVFGKPFPKVVFTFTVTDHSFAHPSAFMPLVVFFLLFIYFFFWQYGESIPPFCCVSLNNQFPQYLVPAADSELVRFLI